MKKISCVHLCLEKNANTINVTNNPGKTKLSYTINPLNLPNINESKMGSPWEELSASITEKQILEFKDAFGLFDRDGDGTVTTQELGAVMKNLGQNPTDSMLKSMIAEVDADNSGTLDFAEFLTMMVRKIRGVDVQDEIQAAFQSFDKDGSGTINSVELKTILMDIDANISKVDIADMMQEADVDGDGQINYTEFANMLIMK